MKPETARFLDYAQDLLGRMRQMLAAGLFADAGLSAYLACFHVAQALIFEREGRVLKTHRGVGGILSPHLSRPASDADLATFLPRAYRFKADADYGIEPAAHPVPRR